MKTRSPRFDGITFSATVLVLIVSMMNLSWAADAVDDSYSVEQGDILEVPAPGVLSNDVGRSLSAVLVDPPTSGTLDLRSDGSFTYTHDGSATTPDSFTYQADGSDGVSNIATVTITILASNAIEASPDAYVTEIGQLLDVPAPGVLGNDIDPEGDPLTAQLETNPSLGTLAFNSDGSFSYDYGGTEPDEDSFTYRATDGTVTTDPVTVTITIESPGDVNTSGQITITFDSVGEVSVREEVSNRLESRLNVRSESGSFAQVTGPNMPTESAGFDVRIDKSQVLDAANRAFARCERLALVAQARPAKYDLQAVFTVEETGQQATDDGDQISIHLDPGNMLCTLTRPTESDGGGGDDGGDDCETDASCDDGRG